MRRIAERFEPARDGAQRRALAVPAQGHDVAGHVEASAGDARHDPADAFHEPHTRRTVNTLEHQLYGLLASDLATTVLGLKAFVVELLVPAGPTTRAHWHRQAAIL